MRFRMLRSPLTNRNATPVDEPANPALSGKRALFYAVALAVVILDRVTKIWAASALANGNAIDVIPGLLKFNLVYNYGSAFGIVQNGAVLLAVLAACAIAVMVWVERRGLPGNVARLAVALQLGGAIGNLIDRLRLGYVVDFVQLDWRGRNIWPVFNVADSAITVGAILLAWWLWNREKHSTVDSRQ